LQALGRGRDGQARHQLAGVVENARGDATHAKFQFFVVAGVAVAAHQGQLALQAVQVGQAVARVAGQAGAQRIGPDLPRVSGGQEQFTGGGQVQGGAAADGAYHLHAGAFAPGAVDVDDFVALLDRQVDGLPGQFVQRTHGRYGRLAHVQPPFHQRPQFQQAHAQLVQAVVDAFDVAAYDQVIQDAMGGGRMQAGGGGQFLEGYRVLLRGKRVQQAHGTLDHLDGDRVSGSAFGFGVQGIAGG